MWAAFGRAVGADAFTRAKVIQRGEILFPLSVAPAGIPLLGMEFQGIGQVHSCMQETRNTTRISLESDTVMSHFGNKGRLLEKTVLCTISLFKRFLLTRNVLDQLSQPSKRKSITKWDPKRIWFEAFYCLTCLTLPRAGLQSLVINKAGRNRESWLGLRLGWHFIFVGEHDVAMKAEYKWWEGSGGALCVMRINLSSYFQLIRKIRKISKKEAETNCFIFFAETTFVELWLFHHLVGSLVVKEASR